MKRAGQGRIHRPFNCGDQAALAWRQRADACVELLKSLEFPCDRLLSLADVGQVAPVFRRAIAGLQFGEHLLDDPVVGDDDVDQVVVALCGGHGARLPPFAPAHTRFAAGPAG